MRGTSILHLALGPLVVLRVQNVLAFTSLSHDHSLSRMQQKLVSPSACENVDIATATFTSAYAHAAVAEAGGHFDESIPTDDLRETSPTAVSATSGEVSRRSALTTLTALALGGRALTRKPKPSSASSTASIAVTKSIKEGAAVGATALQSRPPATKKGLAATATIAAGWGSSVDMPTYATDKARGLIAAAKSKATAVASSPPVINSFPNIETAASGVGRTIKSRICNWTSRSQRIARAFVRVAEVVALAMPAAILYPVVAMARKYRPDADRTQRLFEAWLSLCIHSAERGGAVIIKLCQWAASRPDVFGTDFADKFKKLQDSTTPHKWEHTERCLSQAYGGNWRDHLRIEEGSILGSGCIAQVYKGYISNDEGREQPVAVKVVHPRVRSTIAKDLGILRYLAKSMERLPFGLGEKLKWNNLSGAVEEFAVMLEPQLDLRNEADHIERFNKDFASNPDVIFPELVKGYQSSSDVLVETFCSGVTLEEFCEQHKDDKELRAKMCELGARTMCEMIFNNNFVHSDVHPGNILISPDNKLILLDCGIANEYSERDHDLAINVIAAFIRMDGRRAAEFLIENSNQHMQETTGEQALEVEKYLDEIAEISKTPVQGDFAFKKVSMYINFIMNAASRHHVRITPAFVSMALAIKVQEGIALKLNPHASIIHVANPIIMKAEAKRLIKQGALQRWKTIADDTWRDFKVRRERERNARLLVLENAQSV